jgi:hypothetical protein
MINYRCTETGLKFHRSNAYIKMIMGPFGSGKSTICAMDMLYYAMDQPPAPDGVRYTRWGVIRGSYPNLKATTRNTIIETFPRGCGSLTMGSAPLHGTYYFQLKDETDVHMEIQMWSLDDPDSVEKIKSANWTGCWINEATEVSFDVLTAVTARHGRYPSFDMGGGPKWSGVLMDFNPFSPRHWLADFFQKPAIELGDSRFEVDSFLQPPAAFRVEEDGVVRYEPNPAAENLENLKGGLDYYRSQIALRLKKGQVEEIESLFCLLPVELKHGRPVWPNFSKERHVARQVIEPMKGQPVVVGCDTSGLYPAAVVGQLQYGRWCVLDELFGFELGLKLFIEGVLVPFFPQRYPGSEVIISCDPADARNSWTAEAPTTSFKEAGFQVYLPWTNKPQARIDMVAAMLNKDYGGLMISPNCEMLIDACAGAYRYTRHKLRGSVEVVYSSTPEKNEASHVADALEYFALHVNQSKRDESKYEKFFDGVNRRNRVLGNILGTEAYV